MLTARLAVRYDGNWTAELAAHDYYGEFLAYTFRNNRWLGLLVFSADDVDAVIDLVRDADNIDEVQVLDRTTADDGTPRSAMLFIRSTYRRIPPMETLVYEGFFPIGNPSLEGGRLHYDLLLEDREELALAVDLLDEFGQATVAYLSEEFRYQTIPRPEDLESLIDAISPRQLAVLALAVDRGYFEERRAVTIQDLADELGITKATASKHLRKARLQILRFLDTYLQRIDGTE
ncbi:helix-turn-helix domain-containing protein [Halobacteriales archaeon QS_1_68_17]|nr:MAG: helix-turn-helix domain-containing protein [Halobacteriales archaeon QS_1_68_17]